MRKFFYLLWVDFITSIRLNHPEKKDWKFSLFLLMTTCNALNVYTICLLLKYFGIIPRLVEIDLFPGTIINNAVGFFIQFGTPFILLNYFLIFYKEKYITLIKKFPDKKGKLALTYVLCSAWIGFFVTMLYLFLTH
jgi:hypothetical protein